jgi:dihydrofolate synthase / folylpolyglutamate synthase
MRPELSTAREVFSWAESFTNFERGALPTDKRLYRLERMRWLLERFGSPDRGLRIIHVAGTKGKGSTAAFMASVLSAAGSATGLYTSPHVRDAFERIALPGRDPDPALLVRLGREVKGLVDTLPPEGPWGAPGALGLDPRALPGGFAPTTFELYTLLAFLYFRESGCTDAVVEVGIGGRLDATNVVSPCVSVITPLDLEHTDVLGDTIECIAAEKAGIIKPGVPAFSAPQLPGAREVFRRTCAERGSPLSFLDEAAAIDSTRVDAGGTSLRVRLDGEEPRDFRLSMLGGFQAENAALAYLALRRTRPEITEAQFREGFADTRLPGRMELRPGSPAIVLDGAHTPLAVTRLLESFRAVFPGEAVLLFGSVAGKNPRGMAEILAPAFPRVIVSTPGSFKESAPDLVAGIFRGLNPATELVRDPAQALARAREASGGARPILVTGSFYMVSEIRRLL